MAYDFHYTPTGTGVISGKEVLEQTEDAINDLGNTAISGVQEALDKAEQALTNSENAVDDAQTALNTANNAEGVAIQAQTDVGNLSGTVTNIGNRVTTAEGNISNLQGRMTTAEGNITNLQGRMTTAESNIGNLQTAVSTAQATANSAQQTATTARQQSYVFRYSSTALVASSTNANSLLDNTDNLKVGDKVIDSSGVLFSITAIDTANSTFTVGSALVDLALDANVVHTSGDETIDGNKTFSKYITSDGSSTGDEYSNNVRTNLWLMGNRDTEDVSGVLFDTFRQNTAQGTGLHILGFGIKENSVRYEGCRFSWLWDNNLSGYTFDFKPTTQGTNQAVKHNLGTSTDKWSEIHGVTYYYGSSDTEFSDKFVTTDTNQTVAGEKTFSNMSSFQGSYLGTEGSTNARTDLVLESNKDTHGQSGIYIKKFRSDKPQGGLTSSDVVYLTLDVLENSVRTNNAVRFNFRDFVNNVPTSVAFYPTGINNSLGGSTSATNKWTKINGVEPSSLGMPDLANGIDISSYITVTDNANVQSTYTPPSNGWVCVKLSRTSGAFAVLLQQENICGYGRNIDLIDGTTIACSSIPVIKGVQVLINSALANGVVSAYFYPCQGNV